jgi:stage II sporulation protein D
MRKVIAATAAALLCCASLTNVFAVDSPNSNSPLQKISEATNPRNIQVLLEKDAKSALLEVKGPYYIFNPQDGSRIASGLFGKRFMVHELEKGLKWGQEFPGIHQIYIKPRSEETSIFINGIQYSGAVAIYGVGSNINIVNDLDIEEYVKAILSPQFNAPTEPEVLSALAILTRTNAYFQADKSNTSFWHVVASDVGYQGSAMTTQDSPIDKAVETTKHLILVHPVNGKSVPFAASWTENSAGKTATYQALFRKDGSTPDHGVEAPHAALARQDSKWTYSVSKKALANLLDVPEVKGIEVFIDNPSNKVYGLRIKDGIGSYDFDFFALQAALGKTHILSSDFTATLKEDSIVFSGYGKGHGVGLCLYSATALAQNGDNALKILGKFFPETYLQNIDLTRK